MVPVSLSKRRHFRQRVGLILLFLRRETRKWYILGSHHLSVATDILYSLPFLFLSDKIPESFCKVRIYTLPITNWFCRHSPHLLRISLLQVFSVSAFSFVLVFFSVRLISWAYSSFNFSHRLSSRHAIKYSCRSISLLKLFSCFDALQR